MGGNALYFEWEVILMEWLQSAGGNVLLKFFEFITEFGGQYVLVGFMAVMYWGINKDFGENLLRRMAIVLIFPSILKNMVRRLRPYFVNPGVKCLHAAEPGDIMNVAVQGFSFPSMHTANATVFYGYIALSVKKLKKHKWIVAMGIILPILIGISRTYVGVHYPTDVMCGWVIGVFAISIIGFLDTKVKNKSLIDIGILICGLPGFFIADSNDFYTSYGIIAGAFLALYIEDRYVKFENTKNVLEIIVRTAVGLAIFLAITEGLKLPFSAEFLNSGTKPALLIRAFRYFMAASVALGVYPLSFKYFGKKFTK